MNKLILGLIALCLYSCSSPKHEKAISDWIQTDKTGTWTDLKFKLLEVLETKDLTVGDSVQILKERFERMKTMKLDSCKRSLDRGALMVFSRYRNSEIIENNKKIYADLKNHLDSLPFKSTYDDKDSTEVLATFMKCKYSIFSSQLHTKQEKIETFLLTPDMNKCLGRMKKNI